jgi:hypothetical protein
MARMSLAWYWSPPQGRFRFRDRRDPLSFLISSFQRAGIVAPAGSFFVLAGLTARRNMTR